MKLPFPLFGFSFRFRCPSVSVPFIDRSMFVFVPFNSLVESTWQVMSFMSIQFSCLICLVLFLMGTKTEASWQCVNASWHHPRRVDGEISLPLNSRQSAVGKNT